MPEEEQEIGREGVARVKRLLEGTLRFSLPYNAYQHRERVTLTMLTGHLETYDLNGDVLNEHGQERTRLFIESKNVDGAGSQGLEFKRFLAQAYSATRHPIDQGLPDPKYEFMWATTCPWKGDGFRRIATADEVSGAVEWDKTRDPDELLMGRKMAKVVPDDHNIDHELVRTVATRIWVWVISERQDEMILSAQMRGWLQQRLTQEAGEP
jgi:hypothetical protein